MTGIVEYAEGLSLQSCSSVTTAMHPDQEVADEEEAIFRSTVVAQVYKCRNQDTTSRTLAHGVFRAGCHTVEQKQRDLADRYNRLRSADACCKFLLTT